MAGVHDAFDGLGRLADPWLLVLTSLADGPKHGYAIMTDVAAFSGIRMEPGTLYGALSRLERRGWIRPLATGGPPLSVRDRRRLARREGAALVAPSPGGAWSPRLTGSHPIQYNLLSGT